MEFGKTNKKLKSGKIPIDKKIDFHGKTLLEAEDVFKNSIIDNYKKQKTQISMTNLSFWL